VDLCRVANFSVLLDQICYTDNAGLVVDAYCKYIHPCTKGDYYYTKVHT